MMRVKIIILFIAYAVCDAYSQSKIQAAFQNGTTIEKDGVMLEEDICTFAMDNIDENGIWVFQMDTKKGIYEIKKQSGAVKPFVISIKELNIQELKYDLKHYTFENDSSVYFKGNIIFQDVEGNVVDCFPVRLNLLPAIPKVKNVTLEYDGYDWEGYQFINPIMRFHFTSSRERQYTIKYADNPLFSGILLLGYPFKKVTNNEGIKIMSFDNATLGWDFIVGWDDYFIMKADNDYGSVESTDTILVNRYINDPELWEEYEKWITSINVPNKDAINIHYNQAESTLYIEGLSGKKEIRILRIDGILIKHLITDEEKMYIPGLREGIYIVCITANSSVINQKIFINQKK